MPELIEVHALHYDQGSSDKVWAYMVTCESNMMFDWRAVWGKRTGPKMSKVMGKGMSQARAGEDAAKAYVAKRREGYTAIGNYWRDPIYGLAGYIDSLVNKPSVPGSLNISLAISKKQSDWQIDGRPEHVFKQGVLKPAFCDVCAFIRKGHGKHVDAPETCDFCTLLGAMHKGASNHNVLCICGHTWYAGHRTRHVKGHLEHDHGCLDVCNCKQFQLPSTNGQVMPPKTPKTKPEPIMVAPPVMVTPTILLPPPRRIPRSISHLLSDDL